MAVTVSSASHEMLIRSGNVAHSTLHEQHLQAKSELRAQRYVTLSICMRIYATIFSLSTLITQLQGMIDCLLDSPSQHPITKKSTSDPTPESPSAETLVVPYAPRVLGRHEFPDVPFWDESEWTAHCERQKDLGNTPSKLGFLTDDKGIPLPDSKIKRLTSHAKLVWNELYRHRHDPTSWTKKTPTMALYFAHNMKHTFSEFSYCEGNWKVEQFAITKYPDWCRDSREKGHLTRACQTSYPRILLMVFCSRSLAFKAQKRRESE